MIMWLKYSAELHNLAELVLLLVCDLVALHPCLCKSCNREIFLTSINKNKKYWCFVLPWFSMSMEIEAHQQSSLQWGYNWVDFQFAGLEYRIYKTRRFEDGLFGWCWKKARILQGLDCGAARGQGPVIFEGLFKIPWIDPQKFRQ